jgi:hypothetical protein
MTSTDFDRRCAEGQTNAALEMEDFITFFFAAVMTLGPLAATALYWR